jgi:hypothetical protein
MLNNLKKLIIFLIPLINYKLLNNFNMKLINIKYQTMIQI